MTNEFDLAQAIKALQSGQDLTGKNGFLTPLIKQITEAALKAELQQHLENDEQPNRKNGSSKKTIKSSVGSFELDTPRDRSGSFEPQLVKKNQTKLTDEIDRKILSMFSLGMSYRDIRGHVEDMYGIDVSEATITSITDSLLGFYVDEWGTWYDMEEGREPGFLYQQNTLRDAVVAAVNFNLFNENAKRVHMTNIAQMVNVLQAMILTDGEKMVKTPTYYIYDMYKVFHDAKSIPFTLDTTTYAMGDKSLPAVSASLAQGNDGRIYLALVNLDPVKDADIDLHLNGKINTILAGRILTAEAINAKNTFEQQHVIEPEPFQDWADDFMLPAKSVVVLTLK